MNVFFVFCAMKIGIAGIESWLGYVNRLYMQDAARLREAQKKLDITEDELRKISNYTRDKYTFSLWTRWFDLLTLLVFLGLGGLGYVEHLTTEMFPNPEQFLARGLSFFALLTVLSGMASLPFEWFYTFKIEEKHGFNRQTPKSFLVDKAKGLVLGSLLGALLLGLILTVVQHTEQWWMWAWGVITVFSILTSWIYPTFLAPLFNKFTPLPEGELGTAIDNLAKKVSFRTDGIFVMNASIRSTHGNAYFTGMFGKKRIVLFDTLLEALTPKEIVAVLAHELGHFKLHHVRWAVMRSLLIMGGMLFLLSQLTQFETVFTSFGIMPYTPHGKLMVLTFWTAPLQTLIQPVMTWISRQNEFSADAFARQAVGEGKILADALVKLQKRNHSMPLAHPAYSSFYYSHPPILERMEALRP
jgi:STE24 endopeptidase